MKNKVILEQKENPAEIELILKNIETDGKRKIDYNCKIL